MKNQKIKFLWVMFFASVFMFISAFFAIPYYTETTVKAMGTAGAFGIIITVILYVTNKYHF